MALHDDLHEIYIKELRAASEQALLWWEGLAHKGSQSQVQTPRDTRWPFGPATHPRVIAVVRKYFLACQSLNMKIETLQEGDSDEPLTEIDWGIEVPEDFDIDDEDWMPPDVFLFDNFLEEDIEFQEYLSVMVMLPAGTSDYIETSAQQN